MSTSVTANTLQQSALVAALTDEITALKSDVKQLNRQLDWFKKQLFGSKSEKRVLDNPDQPLLTGLTGEPVPPLPAQEKQTIT